MRTMRERDSGGSRARRVAFHGLAVLLAVLAGLLGAAGVTSGLTEERLLHRVHDIAPSLVLLAIVLPGCVALLHGRERSVAAMQQVALGLAGIAAGWAISAWFFPWAAAFLLVLGVLVVLLVALHPHRGRLLTVPRVPRTMVSAVAVAVTVPLLWFATDQAGLQRTVDPANPHAAEGHYAGMAATAVAFALVALLAAARTDGARLPTWCAGLGIAALGVLSLPTPLLAGSFPAPWGLAAAGGGLALVLAGEAEVRWPEREALDAAGTNGGTLDATR